MWRCRASLSMSASSGSSRKSSVQRVAWTRRTEGSHPPEGARAQCIAASRHCSCVALAGLRVALRVAVFGAQQRLLGRGAIAWRAAVPLRSLPCPIHPIPLTAPCCLPSPRVARIAPSATALRKCSGTARLPAPLSSRSILLHLTQPPLNQRFLSLRFASQRGGDGAAPRAAAGCGD